MKRNYISPETSLHTIEMSSLVMASPGGIKSIESDTLAEPIPIADVPATPGSSSDVRRHDVWDDGSEEEEQL